MSLLDIEETKNDLEEIEYQLYDKFVEYLEKHVPRDLWDHSNGNVDMSLMSIKPVSYIRFSKSIPVRKDEYYNDMLIGTIQTRYHTYIHITPTDDGLVNLEWPRYIRGTFPILIHNEEIPRGVKQVLGPIWKYVEIIHGIL